MLNLCKKYDERQQVIRGNICKHIMLVMAVCIFVNGILEDAGFIWPDKFMAGIILIIVPTTIGTIEMNIKGVYLTERGQISFMVIYGLVALANIALVISHSEPLFAGGSITECGEYAVLAVCFLIIFTASVIRLIYDKHMDRSAEEPSN